MPDGTTPDGEDATRDKENQTAQLTNSDFSLPAESKDLHINDRMRGQAW